MKTGAHIVSTALAAAILLAAGSLTFGQGRGGAPAQSPASQRPPRTVTPQSYTAEQIAQGQQRFISQCGSCHGRDAGGGETGPDLTRSNLVAQDNRGSNVGPLLRSGRVDKGMPAFTVNDTELIAIVAYIHDQKAKAELLGGGRRQVNAPDLRTGNAEAGRQYFNGAGNCAKCHSPTGDLARVAERVQGLALLRRMLYPSGGQTRAAKVTVTLASGEKVEGSLVSRDEFSIVMNDAAGKRNTFTMSDVKVVIDDPLSAHFEQLGKYTDTDMHNVFAYLETLR